MTHSALSTFLSRALLSDPELLVTTPERSDARVGNVVRDLLRLIRSELGMDVAFLAEFVDGRRVFREVDTGPDINVIAVGDSHVMEDTLCQRVVDGRLPALVSDLDVERARQELPAVTSQLASHAGVPVRLRDGTVYGTLCCFSFSPNGKLDATHLKRLKMSARLAARVLEATSGAGVPPLI